MLEFGFGEWNCIKGFIFNTVHEIIIMILTILRYMKFISTILKYIVHNLKYINDFSIYRRFDMRYRLTDKIDNTKGPLFKKQALFQSLICRKTVTVLILVLNSFRLYGVRIRFCPRQIWAGFLDYTSATRSFLLHYTPYTPLHRQLRFTIISGYIGCHLCNFRITN